MKRSTSALAAGCALLMGMGAATAPRAQATNFCVFECEMRCYLAHEPNGPEWRACVIACIEENCSV